ncbi:hypothetical protein E5K00_09435 [Hymenobacter aquaticus]|uniref:Uncharacterized protein n=1 Tax=Hymenobacter aquaticus TaxID=1867101 RepID=A0A4Z0Q8J7_9BACT|nr:hypothetical protein [Hymenobacter aquaticus]TGE25391.1 hypothetical protein E5K00_09435 [Hymenobacter aquaticus]
MAAYELKHFDREDIEAVLAQAERSFNIRFVSNELTHLSTFGELCDYITTKIPLDHSGNCTSQQAFYKLRQALANTLPTATSVIAPSTLLTDLLPPKGRRQTVQQIERSLGFQINLLSPPVWLLAILFFSALASLVSLPFSGQVGLAGFILSALGFRLAYRFASNTLQLQTVAQVAEQMTREHYLHSRRNPSTFNRAEVTKVLTDLFATELELDKALLTRETRFV